MRLEKKVAFTTGANRGLALQTARELGKLCIVVLIGSGGPKARRAAGSLRCDVTKSEDRGPGSLRTEMRQTGHPAQQRGHFYGKRRFLCDRRLNRSNIVSSANLNKTFEGNFFAPPSDDLLIEVRS